MTLPDTSNTKKNLPINKKISMKTKESIANKIAPIPKAKSITQIQAKSPQSPIKKNIIKIKKTNPKLTIF